MEQVQTAPPIRHAGLQIKSLQTKSVWLIFAALAAYLIVYAPSLHRLTGVWERSEEFSHGYFIPLVTAWMLYERRRAVLETGRGFSFLCLPVIVVSFLCLLFGALTYMWTLQYYGFVVGLFAFPLALGGLSLMRVMIIPLLYLFFMVPLPPLLTYLMTAEMQLLSSKLGVVFIRMLGMPVFLTGNVIDLGTLKLEVVEACSGLRYLFPFLSLGFLMAYIFKGPWWQKVLLFALTIPITIIMNSARIAVTALMSDKFGSSWAEGFSHFIEGWMVFIFCIAFLLLCAWVIARVLNGRALTASLAVPMFEPKAGDGPVPDWKPALFSITVFLGVLVAALYSVPKLKTPPRDDLINLPYELSDWRFLGTETLTEETQKVLNADDYVIANFVDPSNDLLNVYVAYLDSQESGKSWHSPRQCLPSGGWNIGQITTAVLDGGAKRGKMPVNRTLISQGDQRILVYFWFDQRGRVITNEYMIKYYLILDTLRQQRSDGALVRIFTTVDPDEDVATAEARLVDFAGDVVEELPAYVPL